MRVLWDLGDALMQQGGDSQEPSWPLAYSTFMTVFSLLVEKGRFTWRKGGRAYVYSPVSSHAWGVGSSISALIKRLCAGQGACTMTRFLELNGMLRSP